MKHPQGAYRWHGHQYRFRRGRSSDDGEGRQGQEGRATDLLLHQAIDTVPMDTEGLILVLMGRAAEQTPHQRQHQAKGDT